jgi:hypothetical protein
MKIHDLDSRSHAWAPTQITGVAYLSMYVPYSRRDDSKVGKVQTSGDSLVYLQSQSRRSYTEISGRAVQGEY